MSKLFCESLKRSYKIVKELEHKFRGFDIVKYPITIKAYSNGREQGFKISCYTNHYIAFTFSENRNSDSIVVYRSDSLTLDDNIPSDEQYKNSIHFPNEQKAADYIFKQIKKALNLHE